MRKPGCIGNGVAAVVCAVAVLLSGCTGKEAKAVPAPVVPVNYSPPAVSHVRLAESAPPTAAAPNPADATGTDAVPTPQAAAPPPSASGPDAAIAEQLHDLAGGKFPTERAGRSVQPMEGRSLAPAFAGKPIQRD